MQSLPAISFFSRGRRPSTLLPVCSLREVLPNKRISVYNLFTVLDAAGLSSDDVVAVQVYLTSRSVTGSWGCATPQEKPNQQRHAPVHRIASFICAHESADAIVQCAPPGSGYSRSEPTLVRRTPPTLGWSLARALQRVSAWCRENRHLPVQQQHATLVRKVQGHINYFGVNGNTHSLKRFVKQASRSWFKWLNRRSQRARLNWERFQAYSGTCLYRRCALS